MFWPHLYDTAHVALSLAAALVVLRLLRRTHIGSAYSPWFGYFGSAGLGVCIGGGIELLQIWGPGEASIADFARDGAGWLGGVLLGFSYDVTLKPSVSMYRRRVIRAVALVVVGIALVPTAWGVWRTTQRLNRLPTLCDFEAPCGLQRVDSDEVGELTIEAAPSRFGGATGHVGKFVFASGKPSGFELQMVSSDWSGYRSLEFVVFTQELSVTPLELRVHDRHHENAFSDRFNTVIHLAPGSLEVSISMEDILQGPVRRHTDMTAIQGVTIFMNAPSQPQTVYFDSFRLR